MSRPRNTQPHRDHPLVTWMRDRRQAERLNPYATAVGIVLGFFLALAVLHHLFH
jgi:hypothetical protein